MGNEFKDPLFQRALMDVHMMVCLNGHERTVPEWCALISQQLCVTECVTDSRAVDKSRLGICRVIIWR